ncbi:GTP 3',8-cyclase MoaA [Frondihabitans australicus]|nr:GTP 3',8-cyclase MoaA [Frondihabitans australicus]
MGLDDRHGRTAVDLRVSLTERCNLRCTYCMPAAGLPVTPDESIMSADEIVRLVELAVRSLGVRKVRFTGGEPLLRRDLVDVVARCSGLTEISLTTNAIGLATRAEALRAAGLERVNVSLDTVDPEAFALVTRRPFLSRVIEGIRAAQDAGLGVKVNAVLLRGVNDALAVDLLRWCLERDIELRFIEQMPLDPDHVWKREEMITASEIRALLGTAFVLETARGPRDGAPAERYVVRAHSGEILGSIGIIASITESFCGDCTRTRLTADGHVRTCLFSDDETDLLTALRAGATDGELARLWRDAMLKKPRDHGSDDVDILPTLRGMSAIGG